MSQITDKNNSVELVAIAKNESRFLVEWLAHYLSLGFDRITVYDHGSTDDTGEILGKLAVRFPIRRIPWSPDYNVSPQMSAYAHALGSRSLEWMAFFDVDEFLVLNDRYSGIKNFLSEFDEGVGAVAINWLTFGSGGHVERDYGLVTEAFRTGGPRDWKNNRHIKTIGRPTCIKSMGIHDCLLKSGAYVTPTGAPLQMPEKRGIAHAVDHSRAQLNHYQCKSVADFNEKIKRGRAGKHSSDPTRYRDNGLSFFNKLDKNEKEYSDIDKYKFKVQEKYNQMLLALI